MTIYQMTATFGKLQHETLTLKPGLNVITASNEWGKSTWCAFLCAMLYGLDTRAKSTKSNLADKERFAPWSGAPMSGRIDLNWNGRDITIERTTKQRIPMGEFRAYETATGVQVPELTAQNCGEMLLGVEESVFRRAGFIRQAELPVTQDESLRQRLNALVTTGDDTGRAQHLAQELKDLRNRCRYNRSGLLPQAEEERDTLEKQLEELTALSRNSARLKTQLEEIGSWLAQLYNHRQALAYQAAQEGAARLSKAETVRKNAEFRQSQCREACQGLPSREEAEKTIRDLRSLREDWSAILREQQEQPQKPRQPELPQPFSGMTPEEGMEMIRGDTKDLRMAKSTAGQRILIIMGVLGLLAAGGLCFLMAYIFAAVAGIASLVALVWGLWDVISARTKVRALQKKYGSAEPKRWAEPIQQFSQEWAAYEDALREYKEITSDLEVRLLVLRKRREALCGQQEPEKLIDQWQHVIELRDAADAADREARQAAEHCTAIQSMIKPAKKPSEPDHLTQSQEETDNLLAECTEEQQRLQNRLGQYQGRMETLGDARLLEKQLEQKKTRIAQLEDTYAALTIAQETLQQATQELQRRFAPRITRRAQELLSQMTGGRYSSILMLSDFSLEMNAQEEDTPRSSLWRSDGTIDQLYLALRLAVAEELTPDAPLVLDDVLVRFDDQRMKAAMELFKKLGKSRQIICFTCHKRESAVL